MEDPALDLLELELGPGDRPRRRAGPRKPQVRVVAEPPVRRRSARARARRPATRAGEGSSSRASASVPGEAIGGTGQRHRAHGRLGREPAADPRADGDAAALLEEERDVGGELARAVGRRAVIRGEHVADERGSQRGRGSSASAPRRTIAGSVHAPARKAAASAAPSSLRADAVSMRSGMLSEPERWVRRADCSGRACARGRACSPAAHALRCPGLLVPPGVPRSAFTRPEARFCGSARRDGDGGAGDGGRQPGCGTAARPAKNSSARRVLVACSPARSTPWPARNARISAAAVNASAGAHFDESSRMRESSG